MALVTDLTARRLVATLASAQRTGRIPSVVAALTRDGSLVWRGSRGEATGEPEVLPLDLQYRIGSITKTMTAVLVMQLRDERQLSLTDPLSTYLPEVKQHGDLTLRALLSHGSGLPAEPSGEWWERTEGSSFDDLVTRLDAAAAALDPGASFHYSNLGYALLGEVVARVSGRPWWECLSDRVLQPLGMLRTTYDAFDPHAQGYSVAPYSPLLSEEPATDTRAMAPAGQVWSTVMDLASFADFLVTGHREVLSPATLDEMSTPQTGSLADGSAAGYGLGLRLLAGGSGTLVGHTGSMPGFQASLFVDRPRRTGAAVLANSTTGLGTDCVAAELLAVLEDSEPSVADPWEPVDGVPREVAELLGVWHWGNTAKLITWDGELLQVADLGEPSGGSRFRLDAPDTGGAGRSGRLVGVSGYHQGEPLEVVRRPDGSVRHLVMSTFVLTRVPYT
jgi:CubicO group peptidase (beta-lactamase class C family)